MSEGIGGLEFMGLRYNVADIHLELAITKKITPTEDQLLRLIELGTIGARNRKREICSKSEFYLEDLASSLQVRKNKIYVNLKSLHSKKLIIRKSTRSKGVEILGLNPKIFGQVLPDRQHDAEKKRHLKLVPNQDQASPESGPVKSGNRTYLVPNQDQIEPHVAEIIEEKNALDSFRPNLDSSRLVEDEQSEESFTQPEPEDKRDPRLIAIINRCLNRMPQ